MSDTRSLRRQLLEHKLNTLLENLRVLKECQEFYPAYLEHPLAWALRSERIAIEISIDQARKDINALVEESNA